MIPLADFHLPYRVKPKGNSKDIKRFGGFTRLVDKDSVVANQSLLTLAMRQEVPERWTPPEGPLRVTYFIRFAWRKSESAKRRAAGGRPHDVRPDLGNLCKMLDDCLVKSGWIKDDAQIASYGETQKVWTDADGVGVVIEAFGSHDSATGKGLRLATD